MAFLGRFMKSTLHVFGGIATTAVLAAILFAHGANQPGAGVDKDSITVRPAAHFDVSSPMAILVPGGNATGGNLRRSKHLNCGSYGSANG